MSVVASVVQLLVAAEAAELAELEKTAAEKEALDTAVVGAADLGIRSAGFAGKVVAAALDSESESPCIVAAVEEPGSFAVVHMEDIQSLEAVLGPDRYLSPAAQKVRAAAAGPEMSC